MKNKLYYAPRALRDLDDIWDYIASDLSNTHAAMDITTEIMDSVDRLGDFAEMGAPLASIVDIESDYRFLVVKDYLVFYRTSGDHVYIDRVLYGRRDYLRILFEN